MLEKMDIKLAAEYIGGSVETMRKLVRNKEIAHYRVGNRIMIRKAVLDEWIANQEAQNGAAK